MPKKKHHARFKGSGSEKKEFPRQSHEGRDRYWIYGRHAVLSAVASGRQIHRLWLTDQILKEVQHTLSGQNFEIKKPEDLTAALPREAVHQGIAAEVAKLPEMALEDIDIAGLSRIVLLDQVTDPHNAGAIIRSAAAFDIGAVVVPRHGAANETATMAKAASGALDIMPLVTVGNLASAIEQLKEAGFWIIGLDGEATTEIGQMPDYDKVALVLGSEGKGLRRLTGELCDLLVKIPMSGRMESLNVSNAAAVAFYSLYQRTRK